MKDSRCRALMAEILRKAGIDPCSLKLARNLYYTAQWTFKLEQPDMSLFSLDGAPLTAFRDGLPIYVHAHENVIDVFGDTRKTYGMMSDMLMALCRDGAVAACDSEESMRLAESTVEWCSKMSRTLQAAGKAATVGSPEYQDFISELKSRSEKVDAARRRIVLMPFRCRCEEEIELYLSTMPDRRCF